MGRRKCYAIISSQKQQPLSINVLVGALLGPYVVPNNLTWRVYTVSGKQRSWFLARHSTYHSSTSTIYEWWRWLQSYCKQVPESVVSSSVDAQNWALTGTTTLNCFKPTGFLVAGPYISISVFASVAKRYPVDPGWNNMKHVWHLGASSQDHETFMGIFLNPPSSRIIWRARYHRYNFKLFEIKHFRIYVQINLFLAYI